MVWYDEINIPVCMVKPWEGNRRRYESVMNLTVYIFSPWIWGWRVAMMSWNHYTWFPVNTWKVYCFANLTARLTYAPLNISVISWQSVLLVDETGVPGENHWAVAKHWQAWSNTKQYCIDYISPWTGFELTTLVVIGTNCTVSCNSDYHAITATTTP